MSIAKQGMGIYTKTPMVETIIERCHKIALTNGGLTRENSATSKEEFSR